MPHSAGWRSRKRARRSLAEDYHGNIFLVYWNDETATFRTLAVTVSPESQAFLLRRQFGYTTAPEARATVHRLNRLMDDNAYWNPAVAGSHLVYAGSDAFD